MAGAQQYPVDVQPERTSAGVAETETKPRFPCDDRMQTKIVFAVICTLIVGFGIFAVVSMSGAGALPTCGYPPGYERQTNNLASLDEKDGCRCAESHSTKTGGGVWTCKLWCREPNSFDYTTCFTGPNLDDEPGKREQYRDDPDYHQPGDYRKTSASVCCDRTSSNRDRYGCR